IRDFHVTGVQTCALPISAVHTLRRRLRALFEHPDAAGAAALTTAAGGLDLRPDAEGRLQWLVRSRPAASIAEELALLTGTALLRSEERRAGKAAASRTPR